MSERIPHETGLDVQDFGLSRGRAITRRVGSRFSARVRLCCFQPPARRAHSEVARR